MRFEDYKLIYEQMVAVFKRDKELTHIEITFEIQPITTDKKTARINVKTYKDGNKRLY